MLYGQDLLDVIKGDLIEFNLSNYYSKHKLKRKKDWDERDVYLNANYEDVLGFIKYFCDTHDNEFEVVVRFRKPK